tara:strand:+ start:315 stop:482 length:168 start_codon:yes stop_codon:yes gene_type:complete
MRNSNWWWGLPDLLVMLIRFMDENGFSDSKERKVIDLILNHNFTIRDAINKEVKD